MNQAVTIYDAIRMMVKSWDFVPKSVVLNSCIKTNISWSFQINDVKKHIDSSVDRSKRQINGTVFESERILNGQRMSDAKQKGEFNWNCYIHTKILNVVRQKLVLA